MSTLLRQFIEAAPIKVDLDFGINENIVLRSLSIEPRLHQGTLVKRNTFMTFTQVDPVTRKAVKEHEYSFFNLNHESEYVVQNMNTKLTKLVSIVKALGLDPKQAEEVVEKAFIAQGVTSDIDSLVLTLKGAAMIDAALSQGFYEVLKDSLGLSGPLMTFKTTVDRKGYLEIPLYGEFIEAAVSGIPTKLKVVVKEYEAKAKAMQTKTVGADKLSKSVGGGAKRGLSLKGF